MNKQVEELLSSKEFTRFKELNDEVNVFEMLGIHHKENIHSTAIASLLNDKRSGVKQDVFFEKLFEQLYDKQLLQKSDYDTLKSCKYKIYRERYHIDLLFIDNSRNVVVAIENKINADEREDQVSDYQNVLLENYNGYQKYMFFLTPFGITSKTKDDKSDVPCYSMSYADVNYALKSQISNDKTGLTKLLSTNIENRIIMDSEKHKLVRDIWGKKENAEALRFLLDNRPKLSDIEHKLEEEIQELTKKEIIKFKYPESRGETKELKFYIREWSDKGIKIAFMFYHYGNRPAFRVLVHSDNYNKSKFEEIFNFSDNGEFDNKMPTIKGWKSWHKLFNESDYPEDSYIDDFSFSDETVKLFMEKFKIAYDKINKVMENIMEK